jgi:acyl-CoA synthetase (AMP-forming)/AMP-acid ligase II
MTAAAATVPELLEQRAAADPDRTAIIVAGGGSITFAQWYETSNALAAGLQAHGIRPGDRVGLLFDGTEWIDFAVAYCGVQRAGAVAVPLSARQPGAALAAMLEYCGASGLIHATKVEVPASAPRPLTVAELAACDELPSADITPQPSDPAQILFTSGTTAFPKGVLASHANLTYGSGAGARRRPLSHSEHFLHAFPIGTNAASMMLINALVAHPAALIQPTFDADGFCALIDEYRVGTVYLIPPTAAEILNSGAASYHDLSSVQLVNSSAAALPPAVAAGLAKAFPEATLINSYTSTEAAPAQTAMIIDLARPDSVGRPVGAGEILVAGPDGNPLPTGEIGEVFLRSGAPQRSYYGDPQSTAEVFRPDWTRMGDVGYIDEDGYLFLVDRESDVIKTGGLRVSTLHVEAVLHEHPAVAQAAVLGVPHKTMGTSVGAAVVLQAGVSVEELRAFAAARLARHEVPGRILVLDDLPRNPTGKVVKRQLRPLFEAEQAAVPSAAPGTSDEVDQALGRIWARVFGQPAAPDADFFALGGDSLRAAQLTTLIGDAFGVEVPASLPFDLPALAAQASWLRTEGAAAAPQHPAEAGPGVPTADHGPLSAIQEHWWHWLNEVLGARQMPPVHLAIRIQDVLDPDALDAALTGLAARQDALRSIVAIRDGSPVLIPQPPLPSYLARTEAQGADATARLADAARLATREVTRPFDVTAGPLLRALLIRLGDNDHVLVITVHHLVFDGWSSAVLLRDLAVHYSALRTGSAQPPATGSLSFADFVAAERAEWPTAAAYWQRVLDGAPRSLTSLPGRRLDVEAVLGDQRPMPLDPAIPELFRSLARRHRMSISMVATAAWAAVLGQWSGSTDLVFAQPVSGRIRPEYEDVVGCVFRWIFVRLRLDPSDSLDDALRQARRGVLDGSDHQYFDYHRFHEQVGFPAYVRFESWGRPPHLPGLVSEPFDVPAGPNMRWPLAPGDADLYPPELLVSEAEDGSLKAVLIYNTLAYKATDIDALAARAAQAWLAMASHPELPIEDGWPSASAL